jgi:hypothetical protein
MKQIMILLLAAGIGSVVQAENRTDTHREIRGAREDRKPPVWLA